ncbi:hypothetical protein GXB85_12975 [Cellulomonas sp. APG4]|uniref:hypothetical protein n=1 Tax=Cellulomonas sp. APG4 TaxID=1538656 RepID=UPI0013798F8C|nr:hypothetical protein [Cellulomonas sp. APG4]NCT91857.1 hypothetical protein [Cellulomonas sp. APG4]
MDDVLLYARSAPGWLRGVGWGVVVLSLGAVGLVVAVVPWDNPGLLLASAVPSLVGGALGVAIVRAEISVDWSDDGLALRFRPLWRGELAPSAIAEVSAVERIDPVRYGGVGLRRVPGRRMGLLFDAGPGIRVVATDGMVYEVRVENPSTVLADLARRSPALPVVRA